MIPTALTQMVARVFNDRYRVEELVGYGDISAVYAAFDSVQQRRVAIKVFDSSLAENEAFLEDLMAALEQAAVLTHPNIVEILDWGVDGGPFIVTELCEGGSLADMLAAGELLDPSQALVMTLECARALNYGHEQGALYGSLNPRNILFSADQRVRLSDYGLVKIFEDAPVRQSDRAIEIVRYASPEQARGRAVGEASDLYSLALVVSEAVSGRKPAVTETVVGTLMERAEAAADLAPELLGLLPSLERCGRLDPAQRPEAEELAIGLLATAETMPRPTALPLAGLATPPQARESSMRVVGGSLPPQEATAEVEPIANIVDPLPTSDELAQDDLSDDAETHDDASPPDLVLAEPGLPRVLVSDVEVPDVAITGADTDRGVADIDDEFDVSALGPLEDIELFASDDLSGLDIDGLDNLDGPQAGLTLVSPDADGPTGGVIENLDQAEPVFAQAASVAADEIDVPTRAPNRRMARPTYAEVHDDADDRLPWWPLAALVALVAAAVAAGVYFFAVVDSTETSEVPSLLGTSYDALDAEIAGHGWTVQRLDDRIEGSVPGSIVAQSPEPGAELARGDVLTVTVSLGNEMVEIPSDLVGLTIEQATSRLNAAGLGLGEISTANNEEFAAGLVVGLDEPTTQKPAGQGVSLRVSEGPEDRFVPAGVIGVPIGDATSVLVALRLQAVEEPTYHPEIEAGIVMDVIPGPGEVVAADSAVVLVVSAGPEPVEMPDVVDLALDEAIDVIEELGLIFVDTTGTPGEPVIGTLPPIGAVVDVGAEVTIILGDPPEDE